MSETNDKEITNLELLESINRSFTSIENKINNLESKLTTDLNSFKLETSVHFNNIETELKGIKEDIASSTEKQETETSDLNDTVMLHDKRIEKLENKVFA